MANILHNGDVGQVCGIFHTVHQIAMLGVCPLQRGVVQVFAFGQIVLLQSIDALYPIGTQYRNKMIFFARFDIGRPECFRGRAVGGFGVLGEYRNTVFSTHTNALPPECQIIQVFLRVSDHCGIGLINFC